MIRSSALGLALVLVAGSAGCQENPPPPRPGGGPPAGPLTTRTIPSSGSVAIMGEVWADNWFAFSLGTTPIIEDSVPITTERSFNAERFVFQADYPLTLNFVVKDYRQNDTGLEYIGTNRQQMGDGGFIAQFTDMATGRVIAATAASWKCLVIQEAPLDKACERASNPQPGVAPCAFAATPEPEGWQAPGFDTASWDNAHVYSAGQVGPKDGYDQVDWSPQAELIWGPDLETDNTLLCRVTVAQ